ncbi:MAG: hypothetical protein E5V63_04260 [Mesorhizobium sp.]|nr:MAG: hypothetical protein E5V63_04260 [Mesorhizobium sp.]
MRAVERTTNLFVASLREALPGISATVERSRNDFGRANYVHIRTGRLYFKVRISDHAIGMRRALSGREDLYIFAGAKPASWAAWLGALVRTVQEAAA